MENQESLWYACSGDAPQSSVPVNVPTGKPKRKMPAWGIAVIIVCVAALIIGSCLIFRSNAPLSPATPGSAGELPDDYKSFFDNYFTANEETEECTIPTVQTTERITLTLSPAGEAPLSAQEIYERCAPSIVAVSAFPDETSDDSYYWGSGVVLTEDGYILTNSHVVEGTCRARITLWDDTEYDALLVGYDPRTDVAVLKIDAHGLTAAEFASTDSLLVGDAVYAIGTPLDLEMSGTFTNGIVSSVNREMQLDGQTSMPMIQTNAALNNGNSGGPLISDSGQVVGINFMKMYARYSTVEGLGFAIPSVQAERVVNDLLAYGALQPEPVLGVSVRQIPTQLTDTLWGLEVWADAGNAAVTPGGAADRAGIQTGDYILAVDGQETLSSGDVLKARWKHHVGDEITLTIWRDGRILDVTLELTDALEK